MSVSNVAFEADGSNDTPDVTATVETISMFFAACRCGWEGDEFANPERAGQDALWHHCPEPEKTT